ncbi:hypothetical protein [Streptomyces sp. WAC08241]|uniref:hypothetical protein n=1 Tax=Streptomyces sp. WAC08241 TaxID=2487421 RepID=UPI000F77BF0D|nr:hypothetical protein [Streptomyces sp. WAC08241]RSS37444.1 hypothetical protein EF906_22990 [Streptomyces sp. WAC08241]
MADNPLPPAVTFQSGAALLVELGIVDRITHQGVRHIAEHDPAWPFGEGRAHPYWPLANATVMATEPFLEFFRERERARQARTT